MTAQDLSGERQAELRDLTRLGSIEAALRGGGVGGADWSSTSPLGLRSEIRTQCGILREWRRLQAGWLERGKEKQAGICAFQAHATRVALDSLLLVRRAGRRV